MKKQTLFDLASMPKMILSITLIVMLGLLFGATSYLLKTPKTGLPIVNPVVEDQCEVDSECYLVYVSDHDYICPPCDTSSENYQCLTIGEMKKLKNKGNKIDESVMCSPCPLEVYRHTCKCENGKCGKVKEESVEEVSITTDKMEYEQGENVKIISKNDLDEELFFQLSIESFDNSDWNRVVGDIRCDCNFQNCLMSSFQIKANSERINLWDQKKGLCGGLPLGQKLRIRMMHGEGSSTIIYSNEFTIKEKSALDPRCGEKVIGIGLCEALAIGYEFDSGLEKCVEKRVGGCSFEIPFGSLEECQEVCEEIKSKDKESCEAAGGKWEINDIAVCNLPTSDSGKECADSSQCEGLCIAELSEEEYNEATQGTIIYTKGKCSGETNVLGCTPIVNDGKVFGILCMD